MYPMFADPLKATTVVQCLWPYEARIIRTLLCWMNAKKTTSPFPPAPLLKNKQQQEKSGKELTAGLEDSTPICILFRRSNNFNNQVLGKGLLNHLAPLLNSLLAQYIQHCRNHNMIDINMVNGWWSWRSFPTLMILWAAGHTIHTVLQNSTRELGLIWKILLIKTRLEWNCLHRNLK